MCNGSYANANAEYNFFCLTEDVRLIRKLKTLSDMLSFFVSWKNDKLCNPVQIAALEQSGLGLHSLFIVFCLNT